MPWPTPREPAPAPVALAETVAPKRVEPKDSTHKAVAPVHPHAKRPEGRLGAQEPHPQALNRPSSRPGGEPLHGIIAGMAASAPARPLGFPSILAHAFFLQASVYLVRPATSYRALELGVDPGLLGLVVASFSILPVFLAVGIGRATDRGREQGVLLLGAGLMIAAGFGLLFAAASLPALLGWNLLLGVGHLMSLIGEQSRLASAKNRNMDRIFGYYTTVTAIAQAAAPLLLGFLGGESVRPDTAVLLQAYLYSAVAMAAATLFMARHAAPRAEAKARVQVKLSAALNVEPATRNTLLASIGLSMMVLCTIDLLQVYLPALAVERGIPVQTVGILLALRAGATVLSRLGLDRLVRTVGRATAAAGLHRDLCGAHRDVGA